MYDVKQATVRHHGSEVTVQYVQLGEDPVVVGFKLKDYTKSEPRYDTFNEHGQHIDDDVHDDLHEKRELALKNMISLGLKSEEEAANDRCMIRISPPILKGIDLDAVKLGQRILERRFHL